MQCGFGALCLMGWFIGTLGDGDFLTSGIKLTTTFKANRQRPFHPEAQWGKYLNVVDGREDGRLHEREGSVQTASRCLPFVFPSSNSQIRVPMQTIHVQ